MDDIRYAERDGVHIAYRVYDGPDAVDLVMVSGFNFPFEMLPEDPIAERLLEGLSSIGRLAVFDRRGVGLSDPIVDWDRPLLDQWSDDLMAVIAATGFERPAIFAWDTFGVGRRFAVRFPEACGRLILLSPVPSPGRDDDEWYEEYWAGMRETTAGGGDIVSFAFPTRVKEPGFRNWIDRAGRAGASPATASRMVEAIYEQLRVVPLEHHLVRFPTLVLHRPRTRVYAPGVVPRVADAIDGAQLVELPGDDDLAIGADVDALVAEIARFLVGEARVPRPNRALAAVLFTDLVSSTERAAAVGDERWAAVLNRHDEVVRKAVGRGAGRVVKTTGDGVLAVLPSASAAVRTAQHIRDALTTEGLDVRIGIHVAEVEARGDDVAGLGVHIAARIMSAAAPGEILVSATIPAVAVSGEAEYEPRGQHTLKGVPGRWELFAAVDKDAELS
jgi:class 3 adenylate cyclase